MGFESNEYLLKLRRLGW